MTNAIAEIVLDDSPIPVGAGVGLKPSHYADVLDNEDISENSTNDAVSWFEVHAENYMCDGGPALQLLDAVRASHPLSFHGVSLSLGSATRLNKDWLRWMRKLMDRYEPGLISEHLSWSEIGGVYLNDLLPLPYTEECLETVSRHIDAVQTYLGRQILIENPSTYLRFRHSVIPEHEFLAALVERTDCGLLLDVNNLYVNARNHDLDTKAWLAGIPAHAVGEFHLAGHAINQIDGSHLYIDDHGSPVADPVWALFDAALEQIGARPTLIEWDTNVPSFPTLVQEAERANSHLLAAENKARANV